MQRQSPIIEEIEIRSTSTEIRIISLTKRRESLTLFIMAGYIQVYTGNGKGKTTAALGLALRAAGAGMRVFIGQFIKNFDYSEVTALKKLGVSVLIEQL